MIENCRQLNQSLEKNAVWVIPLGQPEIFECFVRVPILLRIEKVDKFQIAGIVILSIAIIIIGYGNI